MQSREAQSSPEVTMSLPLLWHLWEVALGPKPSVVHLQNGYM